MKEYYTLQEAMELTGICRGKLHKMCDNNILNCTRSKGKHRLINKDDINKLIRWQTEHEPIPGFPNYTISKNGEIRKVTGKRAPQIMKPKIRYDGYYQIGLRDENGKKHWISVHRLVAITYIPNPSNLPQVNHIDENKLNNHVSNLEWCTVFYNCNYGSRNKNISETHKNKFRCKQSETTN